MKIENDTNSGHKTGQRRILTFSDNFDMLSELNFTAQISLSWYPVVDSDHSQVSGNSVRTLVAACGVCSPPGESDSGTGAAPSENIFFRRGYIHSRA